MSCITHEQVSSKNSPSVFHPFPYDLGDEIIKNFRYPRWVASFTSERTPKVNSGILLYIHTYIHTYLHTYIKYSVMGEAQEKFLLFTHSKLYDCLFWACDLMCFDEKYQQFVCNALLLPTLRLVYRSILFCEQWHTTSNLSWEAWNLKSINSFMTKVPIIQKPVYWLDLQINGLVSIW